MKKYFLILLSAFLVFIALSCREDNYNTDPSLLLTFSTDTISFDTIFTTIGSATKQVRVYNPGKDPVIISSIQLAGGNNSFFKLNIDGDIGNSASEVEIRGRDSLYIFVQVNIDPNGNNNPMVVNDSIIFTTNGNTQDVNLIAYGQDVHLINGKIIKTENWIPDKPYLIHNSMQVDSGHTLTIEAGVQLYFHKESYLFVAGKLIVNGTKENPVVFRGDRLDKVLTDPPIPYDYLPNQWFGIIFHPVSTGNVLNYCDIRNANIGIYTLLALDKEEYMAEITLNNCIIRNNSFAGIYSFYSKIVAKNCLIINNGSYTLAAIGGDYRFIHCSFSKRWPHGGGEQIPAIVLQNYFEGPDVTITRDVTRASFINCIIDGVAPNQLNLNSTPEKLFNYNFSNCLIKVNTDSIDSGNAELFKDVIYNQDPYFKAIPSSSDEGITEYIFDYNLNSLSFAKDKGQTDIINEFPELEFDLSGNSRIIDGMPDLGAYEMIE